MHLSTGKKKKMHDFKAENCILFGKHAEDLSPKAASYITLRDPSKEIRKESKDIQQFLQKNW